MDKLKLAEQALVNDSIPEFKAGDTVNVHYRVREGDKERIQQFEGVVISRRGSGPNQTFICRKISAGNIGVERIFPLFSPFIAKIDVKKEGDVRRSKLYYLRDRQGKAARIKEKDRRDIQGAAEEAHKEKEQEAEPKTKDQKQAEEQKASEVEEKETQTTEAAAEETKTEAEKEAEETTEEQPKKEANASSEEESKKETAASEEEE